MFIFNNDFYVDLESVSSNINDNNSEWNWSEVSGLNAESYFKQNKLKK